MSCSATLPRLCLSLLALLLSLQAAPEIQSNLLIGWGSADITPAGPVILGGMPSVRISTGVMDPITATALAFEQVRPGQPPQRTVLISCDLRSINNLIRDEVRKQLRQEFPELSDAAVILNGTHTHSSAPLGEFGIEFDAMQEPAYCDFAIPRIVAAARAAWSGRALGGISYGLSHAVAGHNRLISYRDGSSKMYGRTDSPEFSHVEGFEDHAVNLLYTWRPDGTLTGVAINLAVPSQVSQSALAISADFWHETRQMLRRQNHENLYVLPQCSAAGDQSPTVMVERKAELRMQQLSRRNRRDMIAARITAAVMEILPIMREHIEWQPRLQVLGETVPLPRRQIGAADVAEARQSGQVWKETYERLRAELAANPEKRDDAVWRRNTTRAYWEWRRTVRVEERFELQKNDPHYPVEVFCLRLGQMAIVTNPFELYLDYGIQMKTRSPAVQTFVVQLAGNGSYLPTRRAVAGGAYGAVPASTQVGPEGGDILVERTLALLQQAWAPGPDDIKGQLSFPTEWHCFIPAQGVNTAAIAAAPAATLHPATLTTLPATLAFGDEQLSPRLLPATGNKLDLAAVFGAQNPAGRQAFIYIPLASKSAQIVTLGFGADWWFQAWLNGKLIADTTRSGNDRWPPAFTDHQVEASLRPGENMLVIRFISGSGSAVICAAGPDEIRASLGQ